MMEDRSTGGLALPAVPPAQPTSIPTDSPRLDARWVCKPEISNAQDSSASTRRRMSRGDHPWEEDAPPLARFNAAVDGDTPTLIIRAVAVAPLLVTPVAVGLLGGSSRRTRG
jgi:hypothetical protein